MSVQIQQIFPTLIGTGAFNQRDVNSYRLALQQAIELDEQEDNFCDNTVDVRALKHSMCPNVIDENGLNASAGIRKFLRPLIDALTDEVNEYAPIHFGISKDRANWFCNVAWYNISKSNGFQYKHNHANSFLTVVYYFDLPENSIPTILHRPTMDCRTVFAFEPEPDKFHEGNFDYVIPKMKEGSFLIFPSHLYHEAPPNGELDRPRISFSMNFIPDKVDCNAYIVNLK